MLSSSIRFREAFILRLSRFATSSFRISDTSGLRLHKAFYAFEPDFFQHNLVRIMDDVVSVIKGSLELWPTLIEICYFQKGRKGLPQIRVNNQRKRAA